MDPSTAAIVAIAACVLGLALILGALAGAYWLGRQHGQAELERDSARAELEAWEAREEEYQHAKAKREEDLARVDALPGDELDRLLSAGEARLDSASAP